MKSFNLSHLRNKPSYNGFDRSFRNLFTAKVGEILPVNIVEMSPGDKVNLKIEGFTRTQPLQTSAFTRITEHYDSFFVPYRLLWRFANDTFTMVNNASKAANLSTSLVTGKDFPHLSLSQIVKDIDKWKTSDRARYYGASKLASLLGYGLFKGQFKDGVNDIISDTAVTPFRFLAYQKIWADWFRNDQWQDIEPWTYNIDYITPSQASVALDGFQHNVQEGTLYDLKFANYKKDYFLGGLPNSQFGDVASISQPLNEINVGLRNPWFRFDGSVPSSNTIETRDSGVESRLRTAGSATRTMNDVTGVLHSNDSISYSVLSIRQAMFVQKWKEIALSGNKDYKTQIEKHFGKSVSNVLADKCTFIDGFTSNVVINDVVNNNLSDAGSTSKVDPNQAFIKGKGVGSANGKTHFEAPEHGIFMTVYYAEPLLDWANIGVDAFNVKTSAEDFAIPELDRIGMDKMSLARLDYRFSEDNLLSYVPRYFEYKSNFDRINGEFLRSLKDWTSCLDTSIIWSDIAESNPAVGQLLQIDPSIMNSIMGVTSDSSTETDQLLIGAYFDMQTTTCLDSNGLPY